MLSTKNEKEFIKAIENEIFIKKNFSEVIDFFSKNQDYKGFKKPQVLKTVAFAFLETNNFAPAAAIYGTLGLKYQQGFCELLQGNYHEAQYVWVNATPSPAINWAHCLLDFVMDDYLENPSFFQIRNFYETSIEYFLQAEQTEYAENLINCVDDLAEINLEVYKYTGRALLNSAYPDTALLFLDKSSKVLPNDPEIFFHMGQYYLKQNDKINSRYNLEKCLSINADYTSAKILLDKLNDEGKGPQIFIESMT